MKISESPRKNGELVIKIPALKSINPIENRRNESIPKGEKKNVKSFEIYIFEFVYKKNFDFFRGAIDVKKLTLSHSTTYLENILRILLDTHAFFVSILVA